jgi:hypothetical protein
VVRSRSETRFVIHSERDEDRNLVGVGSLERGKPSSRLFET